MFSFLKAQLQALGRVPHPDQPQPWRRALVWLLVVLLLAGLLLTQWPPRFASDLTVLLPREERDPLRAEAVARQSQQLERQLVVLVSAGDWIATAELARELASAWRQNPVFAQVITDGDLDRAAALDQLYAPYRFQLLSAAQRANWRQQSAAAIAEEHWQQWHGPLGVLRASAVIADPLNLRRDFIAGLPQPSGALRLRDDLLSVRGDDRDWALLRLHLAGSPYAWHVQHQVETALASARAALPAEATLLASGPVRHVAAGTRIAQSEISTIGVGSLLGVLLLFVLAFRSLRPLVLALLPMTVGLLAALTVTTWWFGTVHWLTLVFGASLIGVSIDYALHFFCDGFRRPDHWTGREGINHILPAITLALLTTSCGYLALAATPFPGLQQMAVFAGAGLFGAWGTVAAWLPLLQRRAVAAPPRWLTALAAGWERLGAGLGRGRWMLVLLLLGLALAGWLRLTPTDDIRALQPLQPTLLAEDRRVQRLLGLANAPQFFLVRGDSAEQLLQRSERLAEALRTQQEAGALRDFWLLSQWVPSAAQQQANYQLLANKAYGDNGAAQQLWQQLALDNAARAEGRAAFANAAERRLTLATVLASPLGETLEPWLLRQGPDTWAAVVPLAGVSERPPLAAIGQRLPGVQWVDRVGDISAVLGRYRQLASWALAAVVGLLGLGLALRYGVRGSVRVLLPSLAGMGLVLAVLGLSGALFNVFSVLALFLVLGIGLDYGLFHAEDRHGARSTALAVNLAAATSLLSFGLLSLSATPFLHTLGLTLLLGIGAAVILASLWSGAERARANKA